MLHQALQKSTRSVSDNINETRATIWTDLDAVYYLDRRDGHRAEWTRLVSLWPFNQHPFFRAMQLDAEITISKGRVGIYLDAAVKEWLADIKGGDFT